MTVTSSQSWLHLRSQGWLRLRQRRPDDGSRQHGSPQQNSPQPGSLQPGSRQHDPAVRPPRVVVPATAALLCAAAIVAVAPTAGSSARLLAAQDDPNALTDIFLERTLTPRVVASEIESALAGGDAGLAASFLALARDRGVAVAPELVARVEDANTTRAQAVHAARSYVRGVVTGAPDDLAGFAGTLTRDLSGWGDVDDVVTETGHARSGEPVNEVVLGLACVGLATTVATVITVGGAAPVRAGVSLVKAAERTGRLAGPLLRWVTGSLRAAVDSEKLEVALGKVSVTAPVESASVLRDAVKEAVNVERLAGVTTLMGDLGRIRASAGTRAALEGLKLSETPEEVARVAKLAERQGSKTSAILKLAGRSAIVLTAVALNLMGWTFSGLWLIIAFLLAIKRSVERATARVVRWRRRRRQAPREACATTAATLAA
jgi:hypothetical protein